VQIESGAAPDTTSRFISFCCSSDSSQNKGICRDKLEASFICFFVQDDEDLDLCGDETEVEKAAAEEHEAAKKAAAGAKKKEFE